MAIKKFNSVEGFSVGDLTQIDVIDANANVLANNLTVTTKANLGNVSNITITGGSANYVLKTDGAGNITFVDSKTISAAGSNTQALFNDGGVINASSSFTFNKSTNTLAVTNINVTSNSTLGNLATANYFQGNGSLITGLSLGSSLGDVEITSANNGQLLGYNGVKWVNVDNNPTVGAGPGTGFWFTGPIIVATSANNDIQIDTLSSTPNTATQFFASKAINNTTDVITILKTGALNRTVVDAGNWDFSIWANANATGGTQSIGAAVYQVIPYTAGTITVTGTGTTRTATASAGTPFLGVTAGANVATSSYLETPLGIYRITATTSNTVVSINTPTGYTNESAVAGNVFNPLFTVNGAAITSTNLSEYILSSSQSLYNITTTSGLGILIYGTTTNNRTHYIGLNGSQTSSHVATPLHTLHDSLAGLQGGQSNEYYHLTTSEYTGTGTGDFVRKTSPLLVTPNIGAANGTSLLLSGNLTSGNASLGNAASANFFIGDGGLLSNINPGNIGTVANANYAAFAGNVVLSSQPNITSLGTLTNLSINSTGNVSGANYISGNYLTGTLTTASQPNITSLGTLTVLSVTGNITSGNIDGGNLVKGNFIQGNGSLLTSITGANINGTVANANYAAFAGNATTATTAASATTAGTVTTASQPNITSVGTLTSLNVTGNISSGNANLGNLVTANFFAGDGGLLSNINAANIATVANANYAAFAGNVVNSSQPNITSLGTLSSLAVTGNANVGNLNSSGSINGGSINGVDGVFSGNLTVNGTTTFINVDTFRVEDPVIELGGGVNGAPLTSNDGKDRGTLLHYFTTTTVDAFMGWDNSNAEFGFGKNVSVTSEVVTWNEYGNIRANVFFGNGSQLTGTIANANYAVYAGTVLTSAQPNITSVGTLTSLSVTGNITSGNANLGNAVRANFFIGDGGYLSNINAANIATVANANYAAFAGNVVNSSQPNITSIGTLTSLNVNGNITGLNANLGNLAKANYFEGNGSLLTAITGANVTGTVPLANTATYAGTVLTNSQPNITSVGTLTSLNVNGNITSLNANLGNAARANFFVGDGGLLSNINPGNIGTVANANYATYAGQAFSVTGSNVVGDVANANYANFAGTAYSVSGANVSGSVANANYSNFAGTAYSVSGANVSGSVANANYSNFAGTAYSVSGGNVSGSVANANYSNFAGTAYAVSGSNVSGEVANANYAAYAGNVINASQSNITSLGTLTGLTSNGTINFTNASNVSLGSNTNVKITGGTSGYMLVTDGVGNLSWVEPNVGGGVGGTNTQVQFNDNNLFGGSANFTFNKSTNTLTVTNITANGAGLTSINGSNVTGTVANANYAGYAGNIVTAAQPNITSVGTLTSLSVTGTVSGGNLTTSGSLQAGDATITGNLTVNGTTFIANVTTINVKDPIIEMGGNPNGTPLGSNDGKDRGTLLHYYSGAAIDAFMGWKNANGEFIFASNVTVSNEVISVNQYGNIRANVVFGNASQLTGTIANANYSSFTNTVIGATQSNITAVGTLTGLTSNGTINFTNASNVSLGSNSNVKLNGGSTGYILATDGSGNLSWVAPTSGGGIAGSNQQIQFNDGGVFGASGNFLFDKSSNTLTVDKIVANGSQLTSITGGNVTGQVANAAIASTVYTAAQPNITSVGTLTSLSVSGNITSGNIDGGNLVKGNFVQGTLITSAQPNITSVGTLSSLNVTGNITSGNANLGNAARANFFIGDGGLLSNIIASNISGTVANANYAAYANVVTANAQPNITSLGALTSLSVIGNLSSGNANLGNLAKANYFEGNGNLLTSINGGNVTGQVSNALVAGTVYSSAQPNITSVGNLTGLTLTGNLTGTYANFSQDVTVLNLFAGNLLAANYFSGDGSALSNVPADGGNSTSALYAGYVTGNAQPNITSVGTLVSLTVANSGIGNITADNANLGNLVTANYFSGNGALLISINGANVTGTVANANYSAYSGIAYSVSGANVSGSVANANYSNFAGTAYSVSGGNVSGSVANANYAAYAGNVINASQGNITSVGTLTTLAIQGTGSVTGANLVSANYLTGTLTTSSQPNITSVGTLSSLIVSGAANTGQLRANDEVIINSTTGSSEGAQLIMGFKGVNGLTGQHNGTWNLDVDSSNNFRIFSVDALGVARVSLTAYPSNTDVLVGGNVTATYLKGDGGFISNLNVGAGSSIVNGNSNVQVGANGNVTVSVTGVSNTVVFTSTGVNVAGYMNATGNGTFGNISGGNLVSANFLTGTLTTNAQPNITSVGTLSTLSVNGNVTAGNFVGNGQFLTNISGSNVTGTVANATYATTSGSATTAGTVTTNAQPNITSIGTLSSLSVSGNATITGNLTVSGDLIYANVTTLNVKDPVIEMGGNPNGTPLSSNDGKDRGTLLHYYVTGNSTAVDAFMGWDNSNAEFAFGSNVTNSSDVMTFNNYGNVRASYFIGNASLLTGTIAFSNYAFYAAQVLDSTQSNITTLGTLTNVVVNGTGSVSGANLVSANFFTGTLTTATQSNIRTVGILTGLESNGTVTFSNATAVNLGSNSTVKLTGGTTGYLLTTDGSGNLSWSAPASSIAGSNQQVQFNDGGSAFGASANFTFNKSTNTLTATNISGNGALLTSITGANVTGTVANAAYATSAGSATTAGTVTTNAQPNITSVGTLSSLSVTANITSGNANLGNLVTANFFNGDGSLLTSLTGANVTGFVPNANVANTAFSVSGSNVSGQVGNALVAGTVYTNAQPNITSVGTLSSLSVTANITSGNANLGNLVTANFFSGSGNLLSNIQAANITGTVANANYSLYAGTVLTNAQPNITSVGTLTSLTITGNGNITLSGSASQITGANIVSATYLTGTLTTGSQSNITSLGTLTGLTSNGIINFTNATNVSIGSNSTVKLTGGTAGYLLTTDGAGNLSWSAPTSGVSGANTQVQFNDGGSAFGASANFTFNKSSNTLTVDKISGNGALLTSITGANVTGTVANANFSAWSDFAYGVSGANVSGAVANANYSTYAGTVLTNAQPNITSVGTLSSLSVTANITAGNVTGANLISANYFTGTLTTSSQPNITSVGTLTSLAVTGNANVGNLNSSGSVNGVDAVFSGNLTVNGTTTFINVDSLRIEDPVIELGGGVNGAPLTSNDGKDRGTLLHYYSGSAIDAFMGWDNSNAEFAFGSNVSVSSEVVTFNNFGNVRAAYFIGNGSQLTGIIAQSNYANFAGTVIDASQSNITSLGNLTTLNVNATVNATSFTSNVSTGTAPLSVQSTTKVANLNVDLLDGYDTSQTSTANTVVVRDANANITANNITGTLTTASQPNITSVGTLSSLSVTGNITSGNINGGNLVQGNFVQGTLTTAAQPNITSVGTLTSLAINGSGSVSGANLVSANFVTGTLTTSAQPNITSVSTSFTGLTFVANGNITLSGSTSQVSGANLVSASFLTGTLTTSSQPNITSLGTMNNITMGGSNSISGGNLLSANFLTGTLTTSGQPNITSLGNLTTLNVSATVNATSFTSNVATGTAPLSVQSTTKVANLNADLLDGYDTAIANTANTIVVRDANGNVSANYFSGNGAFLTGITATPAGSNTQVQFNDAGSLGANANFVFNKSTSVLTVTGNVGATFFTGNGYYLTGINAVRFTSSNTIPSSPTPGDEWYDRTNDIIYKYIFDGSVYSWIDTSSSFLAASTSNTANTLALRDANGNVSANFFIGTFVGTGNSTANNFTATGNVSGNILISTVATGTAPIVVNSTTRVANLNVSYANVTDFVVVTAETTGTFFPVFVNGSTTANRALEANANINVNVATGAFNSTLLGGTLTTAAQPNITSIGSLTGLTSNGTINFINASNVSLGAVGNLKITGGSNGFVLKTDGAGNLSWATDSAVAAGSNTQIQFNDNGPLGASANFVFDKSTNNLTLAGNIITTSATPGNISGANWVIANFFSGSGNALSNIQGANITGNVASANVVYFSNVSVATTGTYYPSFINASTAGNYAPFTNSAFSFNTATGAFAATLLGGTLTTAAQPNITSVGTLSSLSVTANITAGNITGANLISANFFTGTLTTAAQPNVTSVGTLTGVTLTSNGNITLSGSASQITGANLLSANFIAGTLTTASQPNVTSIGSLTGLTVSNSSGVVNFITTANVSLGAVGNLKITGGTPGQVLQTDGSGGLSWQTVTASPGGSNTFVQFNDGGSFGGNTGLLFNKTTTTLTANNLSVNFVATLGDVGNVKIFGGIANYVLKTDGAGNLSWTSAGGGSGTGIANGTSNIAIASANGNITVGVGGTANIAVFTSTGVELGSNANVRITGGSAGQALATDGTGNLSWVTAGAPVTYEFDDISAQADGFKGTFALTYNQDIVSTVTDPFSLLVTLNGSTQKAWIYNTDVVWQNFILGTQKGYTVITAGYLTFADPPPAGSDILVRTYTGTQNTITKKYPFSAADIMLGF